MLNPPLMVCIKLETLNHYYFHYNIIMFNKIAGNVYLPVPTAEITEGCVCRGCEHRHMDLSVWPISGKGCIGTLSAYLVVELVGFATPNNDKAVSVQ